MSTLGSHEWSKDQKVDLILPAHNESKNIESVVREFYEICAIQNQINIHFIITEDGSTDNTAETIRLLARELPITLIHTDFRKGYSRAVIDGLRESKAPFIAACDSDGQYDPNDLLLLLRSCRAANYVIGYRNPRADSLTRKGMSALFGLAYTLFHDGKYKDPSCPFVVFSRPALQLMILDNVRVPFMPQGLWWEISARAKALDVQTIEVPVKHRSRTDGKSVVYKPRKIPRIVVDNLFGLWLVKGDVEFQNRTRKHVEGK